MCFTVHIRTTRDAIEKRFQSDASVLQDFEFRYFYKAFEEPLLPVISSNNQDRVTLAQWGLIPHWAKDPTQAEQIRKGTYNARAESLETKPSFRDAFKMHRCWVIVSGFFEWQHVGKEKRPWFISVKDQDLFALAGLLSDWTDPDTGEIIKTFSIVTTKANPLMSRIHNTKKRMPLILPDTHEREWLTTPYGNALKLLMKPYEDSRMDAYTVNKAIGKADADPLDPATVVKTAYYDPGKLF